MKKIGVLISGGGTNLQAILDACESGEIGGEVVVVISNRRQAYGLERAKRHGVPTFFAKAEEAIMNILASYQVDWVVLAGFLKILSPAMIQVYPQRIINIHPSLIPSFCGKDYYGLKVHEAVYEKGVKVTGATTHFVDEGTDTGPIIRQEAISIAEELPEEIADKVLEVEHRILVQTLADAVAGRLEVRDRRVSIRKESEG